MQAQPSLFEYVDLQSYLRDYYQWRKTKQPGWSYSVWARSLSLRSQSTLIMLVNGQRNPGPNLTRKMVSHFQFNSQEASYFQSLVALRKAAKGDFSKNLHLMKNLEANHPDQNFRVLDRMTFEAIGGWQYYAIRELVHLRDFKEDAQWIAKRLGGKITASEAREALDRLLQLGMLERDPHGRLRHTSRHIQTTKDIADLGIKTFHINCLEQAKQSIWEVEPELRQISGCTFAIKKSHLKTAKNLIREFQMKMCELLENPKADDVYQLEVAFFPLTRRSTNETEN